MRLSEFHHAVASEFGEAYGNVLLRDLVISELSDRTCADALSQGVPARAVWFALCEATDVPESRRHGAGLPEPKK